MPRATKSLLTKHDMKNLPVINGDDFKESCALYTELVFTKHSKEEAYKIAFPDKYNNIVSMGSNVLNANLKKAINQLERTKFVQECFYNANKHWWMKFMGKKNDIFEKLYNDALSDDIDIRDRHNASKIFLTFIPDAPKEDKVVVEVKVGSDEFKDMLLEKKRLLYSAANESIEDAEVLDNE